MSWVCGIDEAGRGPLAGPVHAAAVVLSGVEGTIAGLADSKKLSAVQRERLERVIKAEAMAWAVATATVAEIDRLNILQASLLAMSRAFQQLGLSGPGTIIIDGTHVPAEIAAWAARQGVVVRAEVRADAEHPAVSAASILAKTARDRVMLDIDRLHPEYGFARHKGYGTAEHLAALRRFGPCSEHRRSFAPVAQWRLF